jgi:signal transduction histidine kinase/CheY-like chemotaxis protein
MRIRSRLLILVLAVLIPAFLAAAIGMVYVYSEAQNTNRQNMREVTQALALIVDKEMAKREAILQTLASSTALDSGDLQAFYAQARRVVPTADTSILLVDLSGVILLNTRGTQGIGAQSVVSLVNDLRLQATPQATVISNMYFAPIGQQNSFSIQIPVVRNNRVIYFLEMSVFASQLQDVFTEQQLPDGWLGTIVDRNGVVVARNKNPEAYVGRHVTGTIVQKLATQKEGFNEGTALSGEGVIGFFSRAPQSEWRFVVSVPQRELQHSAVRAAAYVGGFSLLLLAVAVAAAIGVARNTAHAVEQLASTAEKLGKTESVAPLASKITEFDAVSVAMVKAGEDLHTARVDLERRVAEAVGVAERSQRALLQGQKLEALGRLTGGIAHDFNNVLQTLTTGLQVCLMSANSERDKTLLQACQRAVTRGVELARQLMVFGRVQDARLETLNVGVQLKIALPLLTGALPSNITFDVRIDDDLWNVTVDPLQFELALLNLTMNARDAMPNGGAITLEANNQQLATPLQELPAGEYVCIRLSDTGTGMSEEVSARALDPFYTTKNIGQGSGMGLPQAYGFARQSGGTLLLSSEPDHGTTVTFYLPHAGKEAALPRLDIDSLPQQHASGSILFVEDDPLVRETVTPALTVAGLDVKVARNGDEALQMLESGEHFHLVFSDIVMPGSISGIDLAHIIRERFPNTRIVLATGYSERRINLPGVRLLAKPYSMTEVVAALNNELLKISKA